MQGAPVVGSLTITTDVRCAGWVMRPDNDDGAVSLEVALGEHVLRIQTDETVARVIVREGRVPFVLDWPEAVLRSFRQRLRVTRAADGAALRGSPAEVVSTRLPWLLWSKQRREWNVLARGAAYRVDDLGLVDELAAYLPLTVEIDLDDLRPVIGLATVSTRRDQVDLLLSSSRSPVTERLTLHSDEQLHGAARWCRGHVVTSVWLASESILEVEYATDVAFTVFLPGDGEPKPVKLICDGQTVGEERLERSRPKTLVVTLPDLDRHRIGLLTRTEPATAEIDRGFMLRNLTINTPRPDAR